MKPTISISKTGRVTLKIDAGELAGIIDDAAKEEARRTSQPNKDTILLLAEALEAYFLRWIPDSGSVYILHDVQNSYEKADNEEGV